MRQSSGRASARPTFRRFRHTARRLCLSSESSRESGRRSHSNTSGCSGSDDRETNRLRSITAGPEMPKWAKSTAPRREARQFVGQVSNLSFDFLRSFDRLETCPTMTLTKTSGNVMPCKSRIASTFVVIGTKRGSRRDDRMAEFFGKAIAVAGRAAIGIRFSARGEEHFFGIERSLCGGQAKGAFSLHADPPIQIDQRFGGCQFAAGRFQPAQEARPARRRSDRFSERPCPCRARCRFINGAPKLISNPNRLSETLRYVSNCFLCISKTFSIDFNSTMTEFSTMISALYPTSIDIPS